jgi:hypothetical protein
MSLLGSWANPGFQWLPELRETERRCAGRAVVIHLLVEPDLTSAQQAEARYGLAGLPAWLGNWQETTLPAELGVGLIPSVVVIDASGRLQTRLESFENLADGVAASVR